MSETIVDRIRAALDEDERVAREAIQGPWITGANAEHLIDDVIYGRSPLATHTARDDRIVQVANLETAWQKQANAAHIARHDPARVLRQVAAMRKILDRHKPVHAWDQRFCCDWCSDLDDAIVMEPWPCPDITDLAEALGIEDGHE